MKTLINPWRHSGLVALSATVLFLAGTAAAQNLVTNPGFETGSTSPWYGFGSASIELETAVVNSGTYAAEVYNRQNTYDGIAQDFTSVLQPGQTYTASIWVQLVSGGSQTVQIESEQLDNNGYNYNTIASGVVSAGTWTQLSGQFTLTVDGTLSDFTIYIQVPTSSSVSFYVDDADLEEVAPAIATNGVCRVDWNTVYQRIDGFGASSAWQGTWNTNEANMFFSTNFNGKANSLDGTTNFSYTGIGLSLLRSRIAPGGTSIESNIMVMAQARGARVWSTPWSPAATFKSNGNVNGGSINGTTANYQALASQVAGYVASMKSLWGINIYAVSVQNEPDAEVDTYESCNWTAQQIHDYVPYLYSALIASNASATQIMLPESENWSDYSNLTATAMSDSTSNDVGIIADHNYDGLNGPTSLVKTTYGKALWETEVSLLSGSDSSITNGVYYAGRIYDFLTQANVNAWHYWWLMPGNSTSNEGLTDTNGVPAKRMYALGQFARFVRPNYYRINVTNNTGSTLVTAFKDSGSPNFAIVAINPDPMVVTQAFFLTNISGIVSTVTPWVTSTTLSLTNQAAVAVTSSNFSYVLPAYGIVTFVGQPEAPPVFVPIANQTINPGITLVLTNTATNSNIPQQTPLYTLLTGPANATLNTFSGVFNWRAQVSQANSTNTVSVQARDNGSPPLSATNTFKITVNPVTQPSGTVNQSAGNRISIVMTGTQGPDYTLLVSSNLTGWQTLFTTNSPALPVTFTETNNGTTPAQFYRVEIGP